MVSPLHAIGKDVLDENGYPVHLRGAHLHTKFEDGPEGYWINSAGADTFSFIPSYVQDTLNGMASWGMNFISIHYVARHWVENASMRQHFRDIATWANERGLYVNYIPRGAYSDNSPSLPWAPYDSYGYFNNVTEYATFLADVAADLKNYPNVLFGIYNEPKAQSLRSVWYAAWQECINAIRNAGATNLIVVEGEVSTYINMQYGNGDFITSWVNPYPFTDPEGNLIYSDHCYRYADIQLRTSPTRELAYQLDDIRLAFEMMGYKAVQDSGKPVLLGEYGCNMDVNTSLDPAGLAGEIQAALNTARVGNEWGMHYLQWWFGRGSVYRTFGAGANYPPNEGGNALITALGELNPTRQISVDASLPADFTLTKI